MTRLADLIIQFEPELLARHGHHLLPSHVRALGALKACRSRFAPQMLAACTGCHTQRCLRPRMRPEQTAPAEAPPRTLLLDKPDPVGTSTH